MQTCADSPLCSLCCDTCDGHTRISIDEGRGFLTLFHRPSPHMLELPKDGEIPWSGEDSTLQAGEAVL